MKLIVVVFLSLLSGGPPLAWASADISLPEGFRITTALTGVADARSLALGEKGDAFYRYPTAWQALCCKG